MKALAWAAAIGGGLWLLPKVQGGFASNKLITRIKGIKPSLRDGNPSVTVTLGIANPTNAEIKLDYVFADLLFDFGNGGNADPVSVGSIREFDFDQLRASNPNAFVIRPNAESTMPLKIKVSALSAASLIWKATKAYLANPNVKLAAKISGYTKALGVSVPLSQTYPINLK